MQLTIEYWMDGAWFIGRLREDPAVAAEAETLEELHDAIARAYRRKGAQERCAAVAPEAPA